MKKNLLFLLVAGLIAITPACHKSSGGGEATLAVTTSPANGSTQAPAPGPTFPLVVTITSTMPSGGVKIQVTAKVDGSSATPFFSTTVNSTTATNTITITGTPSSMVCLVNVTVTSLSSASNVWSGSYRYSSK